MGKVLIIGAGGVGTVVAHKVAQNPDVFTEIMIASRTKSKCDAVVKAIGNPNIKTAQVDADNVDELVALFNSFKPEIVINVALPYQDLTIMGHGQLRAQGRGPLRIQLAMGLQAALRGSRPDRHSRLRLRPGRERCIYGLCRQASLR